MRIFIVLFILSMFSSLQAVEPLSESSLRQLKAATVFIRTNYGVGSGFLLKKTTGGGLIATNHHVVHSKADTLSGVIQIVFHSGTKKEFNVMAKHVASSKDLDLAILEIQSGLLPSPVNIKTDLKLRETLPVYILGFPFGRMLSNNQGNPEVTIGTGTISSLRKDEWGTLDAVQVDGDLNPGNSGGPMVTPEGDLVGVSVRGLVGTQLNQAVPVERLENLLSGFAHKTTSKIMKESEKEITCRVTMSFTDPLDKVKAPYFYYGEKEKIGKLPGPDEETGTYTKSVPRLRKVKMDLNGDVASVDFTIRGNGKSEVYYFQYSYINGDGKRHYVWPTEHVMSFSSNGSQSTQDDSRSGSSSNSSISGEKIAEGLIDDEGYVPGEIDLGETITKTPKAIVNAVVAGGGRYLVMQYEDMPLLVVYDIATRKVVHNIRVPGRNFIYAAGGYKALVYLHDNNLLTSFDLKTGEKLKTKVNPFGAVVCHLTMGHMNDSVAFVRSAVGTDALARAKNSLLNMSNLTEYPIAEGQGRAATGHNSSYRDFVHRRCSPDMQFITEWCTSHSPQGFGAYKRSGNVIVSNYEHSSYGYLAVSDNGTVFTGNGKIYNSSIKFISQMDGKSLFPGIGSGLFLSLDKDGRLGVYVTGNQTPVATINDMDCLKGLQQNQWTKTTFTLDRRIVFNPKYNSLIVIPETNDRIIHRGFDLEATLKSSGVDYLFMISQPVTQASRGEKYEYALKAKSSSARIKYDLEFGPDGMRISNGGLLSWKPGSKSLDKESVIILVEDSGGEQMYHNFDIFVE